MRENDELGPWFDMDTAPHDGTWVILNVEKGGEVYGVFVGRWKPKYFEHLGTYEWQVFDGTEDGVNHWSAGRVSGWMPLRHHRDRGGD